MWLVDLLIAIGVFAYNLPITPAYAESPGHAIALLVLSAVLCGTYLLRRRYPLAVLAVMLLAVFMQLLLGSPILAADAMLLFAVYNVATRHLWWVSLSGAMATVAWLLTTVLPRMGKDFIDVGQLGVLVVITLWVWTWGTLVRIRRLYVAGLQERAVKAEREREANARIAVANERARIAREIHDIVSHSLSVVVLMSDGAAAKVDSEPERAKSAMITARDTGRTALADMRRMLGVLREDEPGSRSPQPGITQLLVLVEQSRATGLPVTLTIDGEPASLADSLELTAYRVVQEALTNVRKHAGDDVTHVNVRLRFSGSELAIGIIDDGQGSENAGADGGHGLVGMRERVATHGGRLSAGDRAGGGFDIEAVLPFEGGR